MFLFLLFVAYIYSMYQITMFKVFSPFNVLMTMFYASKVHKCDQYHWGMLGNELREPRSCRNMAPAPLGDKKEPSSGCFP